MKLDLGGIAKGYAAGEAIAVLKRHGIARALVAGAGDIVVSGPPPDADGWTVGIAPLETPASRARAVYLSLKDAAISTSGDAERFVEIDGKRYSHIVDPRTGLGVVDRCSVTVVAPDGATADSLDTAAYVLGPERGLALDRGDPGRLGPDRPLDPRGHSDLRVEPVSGNSPVPAPRPLLNRPSLQHGPKSLPDPP